MLIWIWLAAATGCATGENDQGSVIDKRPNAARWLDDGALHTIGFGQVRFEARDGHDLRAEVYRSTEFDPLRGPVWFVMHGTNRDADRYARIAAPVAERYRALAIAIEFSREDYPKGTDYTLGIAQGGLLRKDLLGRSRWRAPDLTWRFGY